MASSPRHSNASGAYESQWTESSPIGLVSVMVCSYVLGQELPAMARRDRFVRQAKCVGKLKDQNQVQGQIVCESVTRI
jgi:hypothetical protein